jgi:L-ascorbate metabolism protein UlaG (beta-lactamase superfamily)
LAREAKDKFAALEPRVKIFNPAWGAVTEATIGGVPLKIYPVNHADFPQEYQTLAYLMNVEGVTLFHLGDSVPQANRKFFESFGLEKAGIDIAFLDSFFLRDPAGLEILPKFIRPDRIIPMHLTREENATLGPELAKAHPSLVLFRDLLDTRTFRKTNIK